MEPKNERQLGPLEVGFELPATGRRQRNPYQYGLIEALVETIGSFRRSEFLRRGIQSASRHGHIGSGVIADITLSVVLAPEPELLA